MPSSTDKKHYLDLAHDLDYEHKGGSKYSELAANMKWSASKVRHYVRLARSLSPETEDLCLRNPELTLGHAKLLASHPPGTQIQLARAVLAKGWSVARLQLHLKGETEAPGNRYYQQLSEGLSEQLGHSLKVIPKSGDQSSGTIVLHYYSGDDFDALCDRLGLQLSDLI